jgi:hypothetical protein
MERNPFRSMRLFSFRPVDFPEGVAGNSPLVPGPNDETNRTPQSGGAK